MYRLLILIISIFMVSCSTKVKVNKNSVCKIKRPKHKLVVPYSKDIYSTQKYSRFMYQNDCTELLFRRDDMYDMQMKYDPLSVLEVTSEIEKDIKKNRCDRYRPKK